jgi:hypothetical protein
VSDITPAFATADASAAWAQRRDESPEAHAAFLQWLALTPRPAPLHCGPGIGELAAQQDWLGRAQAYDARCQLLRLVPNESPSGHVHLSLKMWAEANAIEAIKLRQAAASSKSQVIDQTTQLSFFKAFAELAAAFRSNESEEDYDASDLTPEEQSQLLLLLGKLKRKEPR